MREMKVPMTSTKLLRRIQLNRPILEINPDVRAPVATPATVRLYTIKILTGSASQPSFLLYARETTFHAPRAYPSYTAPNPIVKIKENRKPLLYTPPGTSFPLLP